MSRVVMPRAYRARILSICAFQPRLPLFDQLGLERGLPVTRHLDVHMPLLAFQGFLTMPITRVADGVAFASIFGVAQVRVQFGFQATLNHRFGQFFEQATFPQHILGCLVVLEQFINQFASYGHASLLSKIQVLCVQALTISTNYCTVSSALLLPLLLGQALLADKVLRERKQLNFLSTKPNRFFDVCSFKGNPVEINW